MKQTLLEYIMNGEIYKKGGKADIRKLKQKIIRSGLDTAIKCEFIDYLTADKGTAIEYLRKLIFDFFEAENAIKESRNCDGIIEWSNKVIKLLNPSVKGYSSKQINLLLSLIVYEQVERDPSYKDLFCRFTELYRIEGGIF